MAADGTEMLYEFPCGPAEELHKTQHRSLPLAPALGTIQLQVIFLFKYFTRMVSLIFFHILYLNASSSQSI
jgi:hypothetical protein